MSAKFDRTLTLALFLLGIAGMSSIGLSLFSRYRQLQQLQSIQEASERLATGQYVSAIANYDRLLETNFTQPEILWTNRGYAYLGLDEYQSALQSCLKATESAPQAALAWNCLGEAQFHLGNYDAAQLAFQRAIAQESENPTYKLNQSQVLQQLDQHRLAIRLNQQAIALFESQQSTPKSSLALAFKRQGQSWLELNQNPEALRAFKQSLIYQPEDFSAQQGRAIALYRLGKYSQSIKASQQLLARPDLTVEQEATNWLYQGLARCQTAKRSTADQALSQVIKLSQNPEYVKLARAGCGIR